MNSTERKTLQVLFSDPVNGGLKWSRVEALFLALGCQRIEGSGSSVIFEKDGMRAYFHRPHPRKEALRYRVKDARAFLLPFGVCRALVGRAANPPVWSIFPSILGP